MINFTINNDNSLVSYGVGQIHLIKTWLDEMGVKNYVINNDLTVDVKGNVNLNRKKSNYDS